MPNQIGANDHVLIQGRISYGMSGTAAVASQVDASGGQVLAAGTAAAGTVAVSNIETIQTELYAAASLAASSQAASTVLSLVGVKRATFFIDHGRAATTAFGTNGTEYRIEASQKATGNDTWVPLVTWQADITAAQSLAASGNHAVGAGTITILSGSAVAVGDEIFWANSATPSNSEWMVVTAISGTASFNIKEPLTYAQSAAVSMYTKAQRIPLSLNVEAITRVKVAIDNNASGTTLAIYSRIACITQQ